MKRLLTAIITFIVAAMPVIGTGLAWFLVLQPAMH